MREIIYLQAGSLTNHTGTHFWNTQEAYLSAEETEDELVEHARSFRESRTTKVRTIASSTWSARSCPAGRDGIYTKVIDFRPERCDRVLYRRLGMHGLTSVQRTLGTPRTFRFKIHPIPTHLKIFYGTSFIRTITSDAHRTQGW
jgi:hypothetical protein